MDILRGGLQADQNDLFALLGHLHSLIGGEDHLAAGGARGGGEGGSHRLCSLQGGSVKLGMEQSVQLFGIHHADGLLLGDHPLVHQVAGDLEGGGGGALAVAGLEHVQLLVLDGELHVLHIPVMLLQGVADLHKLVVALRHDFLKLIDGVGGAHAGHHVLALGVHQKLAEEFLFAGGGVAGKGHAGAGGLAHVAKDHHLHVDGGAPRGGDVVHAAVVVGAGVIPAAENGLDGAHQLHLGVLGEIKAFLRLELRLELAGQLLQVLGGELGIQLDAALLLHLVNELFKVALAHFHNHIGVHLDKPAVGIVGEAGVIGQLGEGLHHLVVEAQVQDGVHHTGHRGPRAGTDRNQQRVFHRAELLAGDLLQLRQVLVDFGLDLLVDLLAVGVILGAGLGGDGEALGNRHSQAGHLGQVGALAAQQLPHGAVAFLKQIHKLAHWYQPPKIRMAGACPRQKNRTWTGGGTKCHTFDSIITKKGPVYQPSAENISIMYHRRKSKKAPPRRTAL